MSTLTKLTTTADKPPRDPMAVRDYAVIYYIGVQPWLPHYVTPGVFVAPGGYEKTERQLLAAGARKATAYLWPRHWQPVIPARRAS